MSDKVPMLKLTDDKIMSVRIWQTRFNSHCMLQDGWRDPAKELTDDAHWIPGKAKLEIAAFNLGLPDEVLLAFTTNMLAKMSAGEKAKARCYPEKLEQMYLGQDNIMPERNSFMNCIQAAGESITKYETRIRQAMRNTRYKDMENPEDELMRDRFCSGVKNTGLRGRLLTHFKDDGKTPWTFDEKLTKAKAWESSNAINTAIEEQRSGTAEQVHYTNQVKPKARTPSQYETCGSCGGSRHPRRDCPAKRPATY